MPFLEFYGLVMMMLPYPCSVRPMAENAEIISIGKYITLLWRPGHFLGSQLGRHCAIRRQVSEAPFGSLLQAVARWPSDVDAEVLAGGGPEMGAGTEQWSLEKRSQSINIYQIY